MIMIFCIITQVEGKISIHHAIDSPYDVGQRAETVFVLLHHKAKLIINAVDSVSI